MRKPNTSTPVVGLILAGGTGQRIDSPVPKQFVKVHGQTILNHTLKAFRGIADDILVVCLSGWNDSIEVPCMICEAGATGFESLSRGIAALASYPDETMVMIHDAVRPLVTPEIIRHNIEVARKYGNAITAIETYETLLSVPENDGVVQTMTRREGMYRAQTPQTFTLGALRKMTSEAHRLSITDPQSACVLAQQLGYQLHISPGDMRNFKITTPSDLALYEALIP